MKTLKKEDFVLIDHRLKNLNILVRSYYIIYGLADPLKIEERCTLEE